MRYTDSKDQKFMKQALGLAKKGAGTVSPNPVVGAVIVKGGRVIGKGYHQKAGHAHAEVNAVLNAQRNKANCAGATLYVTLEPCSSHGRTPPCTYLIIKEQFARVVVGCLDPDSRHWGRGIEILEKAGIQVDTGCLEEECIQANRIFFTNKLLGRPFFLGKIALTRDGKINGQPSKWITTLSSRKHAHSLRYLTDAIMVGAGTVLADNPSLTLRHGYAQKGKDQPWRFVLSRKGTVPKTSKLLTDEFQDKTFLVKGKGTVTPKQVAHIMTEKGITSCLVEGGVKVLECFLKAGVIDEFYLYQSSLVSATRTNAIDGSKLLHYLDAPKYRLVSRKRIQGDCLRHYISSSSESLLRTISIKRRRRTAVVPKRK